MRKPCEDGICPGETHPDALYYAIKYREALEEILSPPDKSKGEFYGCIDLNEARMIAKEALAAEGSGS